MNQANVDKFSFAHVALHNINQAIRNVCVCQVSEGGTCIAPVANVDKGSWSADYDLIPVGTPKLLQELENRYNDLIAYCSANNITVNVKGLLWHQGEEDFTQGEDANYAVNFSAMITKIRSFTGNATLPIFYGTVNDDSTKYSATIRASHLAFAAGDNNAYCRDNNDLTMFDTLHFDAESCVTFGEWVYNQYVDNY